MWCCCRAGRWWRAIRPAALKATVGAEVAEIEGPGAERLARALRGLGVATALLRTERGYRVGISGEREAAFELATTAPGIERLALRPATLEDVYFARTQRAEDVGGRRDASARGSEA